MGFLNLFFGFDGRLDRKEYFLLSFAAGLLFGGIYLLLMGMSVSEGKLTAMQALKGGLHGIYVASPPAALAFLTGTWVQLALVYKRSRDFSGKTTFAKVYTALILAPMVILSLVGGEGGVFLSLATQVLAAIPLLVMLFMLTLKKSLPADVSSDERAVFGDLSNTAPMSLGEIDEETDLVARAQQLREMELAAAKAPPAVSQPVASPPSGFGRRQPATFGNR